MHQQVPDPGDNAHKAKPGGTQSPNQLNAGPWRNLDKKRRAQRDEIRARFNVWVKGWDAYHKGKPRVAPGALNVNESQAWHSGHLTASRSQALEWEAIEEIRRL